MKNMYSMEQINLTLNDNKSISLRLIDNLKRLSSIRAYVEQELIGLDIKLNEYKNAADMLEANGMLLAAKAMDDEINVLTKHKKSFNAKLKQVRVQLDSIKLGNSYEL